MPMFRWFMPTEVILEQGCFGSLGRRVQALGRRPVIVTGRSSARRSGALERALAQLPGAFVFDAVEENPTTATCETGARRCREAGCDVVVAIGGGSPMDAAKVIAMLARNPGACGQYFGADVFQEPALPIVAVPTTAGTGSETTPYAVITEENHASKRTIAGRSLFPKVALLDPELSLTMPRAVTVATGLDALSQLLEGALSLKSTPMGDALAVETCRTVQKWLPKAASEPENLEARTAMLYAAMVSGCIIAQSGTTAVHGLGYYFTLSYGLAHGIANALFLVPMFRRNARHVPDKVAALATALGQPARPDPEDAARAITKALTDLAGRLGVSLAGRDWGVRPEDLSGFAASIHTDPPRFKNQPGAYPETEIAAVFEEAYAGPR